MLPPRNQKLTFRRSQIPINMVYDLKMERVQVNGKRHYVTPEGHTYPSMTTILSKMEKPELQEWVEAVGEEAANDMKVKAARFGQSLHNAAEQYLLGQEVDLGFNHELMRRFSPLADSLDANMNEVLGIECMLYSDKLKIAGATDVMCRWKGKRTVLDFKQSNNPKSEDMIEDYFYQTAGYGYMWTERMGKEYEPEQLVIVMAPRTGPLQIFEQPYKPWFKKFVGFLDSIDHKMG